MNFSSGAYGWSWDLGKIFVLNIGFGTCSQVSRNYTIVHASLPHAHVQGLVWLSSKQKLPATEHWAGLWGTNIGTSKTQETMKDCRFFASFCLTAWALQFNHWCLTRAVWSAHSMQGMASSFFLHLIHWVTWCPTKHSLVTRVLNTITYYLLSMHILVCLHLWSIGMPTRCKHKTHNLKSLCCQFGFYHWRTYWFFKSLTAQSRMPEGCN